MEIQEFSMRTPYVGGEGGSRQKALRAVARQRKIRRCEAGIFNMETCSIKEPAHFVKPLNLVSSRAKSRDLEFPVQTPKASFMVKCKSAYNVPEQKLS
jgi:hypothetical protein